MDWNSICRIIRNIDKQSEIAYQRGIKEMILEFGLGWNNEQITEQLSLQLGSTERLVPDILVQKDERNSFIIEVKKPGHKKTNRNIDQLLSYMKQLEIPVGIYWGDDVEVYWKTIGDGSAPLLLLSLNFNVLDEDGEVFVSLFSEENYSVDKVRMFKNEREAKAFLESRVNDLLSNVLSAEFTPKVKRLIRDYLINTGKDQEVVECVMDKVLVSILRDNNTNATADDRIPISNSLADNCHKIRANRGTAQRFAYSLIRQIIEKNPGLNFEQLYAIFRRKNRIEKLSQIKDVKRWCLAEEDILTLSDGTKVAISNQWGFNGASKPNMDNLCEVAKKFGIDTSMP